MVHCMAIDCTNPDRKRKGYKDNISLNSKGYVFDKKWIIAIKGKDPPLTDKSSVSSEHILEKYLKVNF